MAVGFDTSDVRRTTGGTSITFSYTVTGSNPAIITTSVPDGANTVTAVSYNSVGLTNLGSTGTLIMWGLGGCATGANNLTFTVSAYDFVQSAVASFTGTDTTTGTSAFGTAVTNTGTSTAPSTGSITCPSGGAVYGREDSAYTTGVAPTITVGTLAGTIRFGGNGHTWAGGYALDATTNITWAISSSAAWAAIGVPLSAPAAGGPAIMGRGIWVS